VRNEPSQRAERVVAQPERGVPRVPDVGRHPRQEQRITVIAPHAPEAQAIPRLPGQAHYPRIGSAKRIRHGLPHRLAQALHQGPPRAAQLVLGPGVVQPGEPGVRGRVGGKVEPPRAPPFHLLPGEVGQPPPRVAGVPRVGFADEVGDEEGRRGEAQIGEEGIGDVGERGVAIVEGEEKLVARRYDATLYAVSELRQGEGLPAGAGQGAHLALEHRAPDARHPQLQRPADAVVAKGGYHHFTAGSGRRAAHGATRATLLGLAAADHENQQQEREAGDNARLQIHEASREG